MTLKSKMTKKSLKPKTLKNKKPLKKNKILKPKTLKNKKPLKKNKTLKPKILKHKKSLKVGAKWGCSKCTLKNPEMNSRCRMCFNPKSKSSGGKKKTKKKSTILEGKHPYVFTIEYGLSLIARNYKPVPLDRTFNIYLSHNKLNLGLFQYRDNSCWLDSGLFALFITRNITIYNALFVNPLLPLLRRGTNEVEMICSALEIVGDEQGNRLRQITARGAIRDEMSFLHNHIFTQRERGIILKEGLRKLLGSLGLSNLDWGGIRQANSEEFIGKLLELFPVKEEEKISVIIRKGYALKKEDLLLPHEKLIENQRNLYEQCKILIRQSVARDKIKTYFKYVHNDMTEDKQGILMIIPQDIIKHSTDNFVTPYLSDLLFGKQILPAANGDIVKHSDGNFEGGVNCEFKFNSYEKIVKCPGGILLVHLYRIVPVYIEGESERDMQINILRTIIIPEFTIYPEGTEKSALYLTAVIVFISGHYTCYFRHGIEFFLFNDLSSTIKPIGKYSDLINHTEVKTNGVFFIYKAPSNSDEERIIKQNYSGSIRISNPPSDSGGGGGSAKPSRKLTLLDMAKQLNIPNCDKMNNETLRKKIDERLTLLEQTKGLENQEAMTNEQLMEYVKEAKKYNLLN